MLISKSNIATGDIVCFKVVTGDEVVAKVTEINETNFVVNRPFSVVAGQQGIGLMPTLFTADINTSDITLNKNHVIMYAPAVKDIVDHYIKTTTGIQTAPSGIIK